MRRRRGAPPVGIRIYFDHPRDPEGQRLVDRGMRWHADENGVEIDIETVWPQCARERITEDEYRYMVDAFRFAVSNAPMDPRATPRRKTDWDMAPPTF